MQECIRRFKSSSLRQTKDFPKNDGRSFVFSPLFVYPISYPIFFRSTGIPFLPAILLGRDVAPTYKRAIITYSVSGATRRLERPPAFPYKSKPFSCLSKRGRIAPARMLNNKGGFKYVHARVSASFFRLFLVLFCTLIVPFLSH